MSKGPKLHRAEATVEVKGIKVAIVLPAESFPRDVLPPEGQPGEVALTIVAPDGRKLTTVLNAKNYRKAVNTWNEHEGNVVIVLQGKLGDGVIEEPGFTISAKK